MGPLANGAMCLSTPKDNGKSGADGVRVMVFDNILAQHNIQLYRGDAGYQNIRRKPPICRKSLIYFIT